MNEAVMIAALGIVASCVAGLLWVIKFMFNKMIPAIDKLSDTTVANTRATQSADRYLRERNGRDSEFHKSTLKAIKAIPTKMQIIADNQAITLLENLKKQPIQNIEHQNVKEQVVRSK